MSKTSYKDHYVNANINFDMQSEEEKILYEQLLRFKALKGMSWKALFLEGLMYLEPKLIDHIINARMAKEKRKTSKREEI